MSNIIIIGTGFNKDQLTMGAMNALMSGARVILHTERCGVSEYLNENGIEYCALDELYETFEDFDEHAEAAADYVLNAAESGDVVYCVMDVRDTSARILSDKGAKIIAGPSAEGVLMAFAEGGVQLYYAADWEKMLPNAGMCTIVREIDNRELACEVKLKLMEAYPDDSEIIMLTSDGKTVRMKLYDLDRHAIFDHRVSVLVKPENDPAKRNEIGLRELVGIARQHGEKYAEGDAADIAEKLADIAGKIAYAEDRGEYSAADMLLDAKDMLIDL